MSVSDSREFFPEAPLSLPIPDLDEATWDSLGLTMMNLVDINLGNRSRYDRMLDTSEAMVEMRKAPRNTPWPNAANLASSKVPEKVFETSARVIGTVFQPRFFTMAGNDPLSSQYAHASEQFYNNESTRLHPSDQRSWIDAFETCVELATRDGVAYSEIMWDLSIDEQVRYAEGAFPGAPREKKIVRRVLWDAPVVRAVESRDLVLIPNYAPSIGAADAVCRKLYMGEHDLWKAVAGGRGIFRADKVEAALSYVGPAQGELSYDRQRAVTYTTGGLMTVSDTTVAPPSGLRMTRGPIEVWQCLTNQFYIDDENRLTDDPGKGKPQECFVWVHDRSRIMLGIAPYEYWGGRNIFDLSLWPRFNRVYGMGVPWLVKGPVQEKEAISIARLDYLDMATQPMRWRTRNARFRDEDRRWGPDAEVEVTAGSGLETKDFGFVGMPPWPPVGDAEEDRLDAQIEAAVASPQAPATVSPGQNYQRSARAAQTDAAVRGMSSNRMNQRVRRWAYRNFRFLHGLYQQYAPSQVETVSNTAVGNQRVVIPKEILGLDYTLGISGMGGTLDKEQRRMDVERMAAWLIQTPLVQGNLPRIWTLARMVLETYDVPEVTSLIGTMDDAIQQAQGMAQQAQMQQKQQMLMAILSHGAFKPNAQARSGGGGPAGQFGAMAPFGSAKPARMQPGLAG